VYFQEFALVLLVIVYRKGEMDDISAQGRKAIKALIEKTKKELASGPLKLGKALPKAKGERK
jgi:hypothetical protein